MASKPLFAVDIALGAQSALEAHDALARLSDEGCYHTDAALRLPLGIYNVSVSRVCDKVTRLCRRLETYFRELQTLEPHRDAGEIMQEITDYIELALYAAAEHVDDLSSIADGFFRHQSLANKDSAYRQFSKAVKEHKRFLSSAANAIKHQQSRIRIFSMEFSHANKVGLLHGYFIEGVDRGAIGPSKVFHGTQQVFSMTTLAWEILLFLLRCSRDLAGFLAALRNLNAGPVRVDFDRFSNAVVSAARLPLYTFGEDHPFSQSTLQLYSSADDYEPLQSGLYGSIRSGWVRSSAATFGSFTSRFEGDGKTKQFNFARPKSVALQHWD